MSTLTLRQESARLCADRLYIDPARAEFRINRPTDAKPHRNADVLELIAVYDARGHRAIPLRLSLEQRLRWTRELTRHAYALAHETNEDLTDELGGFSIQFV
ncbi:hypothetical protein [Streptomyces anulatus]|uniref:hypothetical protein n=1 Tax=Streptomyces anulatus TaxID=1892 RepID=UPI002F9126A8